MTDSSLITPGKLILTFLSYFLHRAVMRNGLSDRDKTVHMNENTFIITPRKLEVIFVSPQIISI